MRRERRDGGTCLVGGWQRVGCRCVGNCAVRAVDPLTDCYHWETVAARPPHTLARASILQLSPIRRRSLQLRSASPPFVAAFSPLCPLHRLIYRISCGPARVRSCVWGCTPRRSKSVAAGGNSDDERRRRRRGCQPRHRLDSLDRRQHRDDPDTARPQPSSLYLEQRAMARPATCCPTWRHLIIAAASRWCQRLAASGIRVNPAHCSTVCVRRVSFDAALTRKDI